MKRYIFSISAVMIAIGSVAFTHVKESNMVNYHWYKRTAANTYVADGTGANPASQCSAGAVICAKGFTSPQTPAAIKDVTTAQTTRFKNSQ